MVAACVALGATACGRHVYLGSAADGGPEILWQATFEPGDLSEWLGDGNGGIYMDNLAGAPAPSQEVAHRGAFSGIATFSPTVVTSFSYLFREQPSPPEAYYGAWFYIPASLQIRSWLSLHHFGYRRSGTSTSTRRRFISMTRRSAWRGWELSDDQPTEAFGPGFPSIGNWFECALNACTRIAAAIALA